MQALEINRRCCGSSHGLLAYADDKSVIILLNPFTGCAIRLPPVTKVPRWFSRPERYIRKVVLSADPYLFPNDCEALVIYDYSKKIAHLKLRDVSTKKQKKKSGKKKKSGDYGWTHIATDSRSQFSDVIHYKGQFLVVSCGGSVFSINVNGATTEPYINEVVKQAPLFGLGPYLVESSRGELLLIMKFEGSDFHLRMTVSFKVFKLLCASGDRPECVEEIESIGSDALFLGEVESMCVSALDFLGCQPNCIYFTTSFWGIAEGPLDMAAFNLAPRRTETPYFSSSRLTKSMPSLVWILPTVVLKP